MSTDKERLDEILTETYASGLEFRKKHLDPYLTEFMDGSKELKNKGQISEAYDGATPMVSAYLSAILATLPAKGPGFTILGFLAVVDALDKYIRTMFDMLKSEEEGEDNRNLYISLVRIISKTLDEHRLSPGGTMYIAIHSFLEHNRDKFDSPKDFLPIFEEWAKAADVDLSVVEVDSSDESVRK